jgi:hypothetical protein
MRASRAVPVHQQPRDPAHLGVLSCHDVDLDDNTASNDIALDTGAMRISEVAGPLFQPPLPSFVIFLLDVAGITPASTTYPQQFQRPAGAVNQFRSER